MTQDHKEMPREPVTYYGPFVLKEDYDKLQAENERLREALKNIIDYNRDGGAADIALEALEGK